MSSGRFDWPTKQTTSRPAPLAGGRPVAVLGPFSRVLISRRPRLRLPPPLIIRIPCGAFGGGRSPPPDHGARRGARSPRQGMPRCVGFEITADAASLVACISCGCLRPYRTPPPAESDSGPAGCLWTCQSMGEALRTGAFVDEKATRPRWPWQSQAHPDGRILDT